jgi:hypothetical protein
MVLVRKKEVPERVGSMGVCGVSGGDSGAGFLLVRAGKISGKIFLKVF